MRRLIVWALGQLRGRAAAMQSRHDQEATPNHNPLGMISLTDPHPATGLRVTRRDQVTDAARNDRVHARLLRVSLCPSRHVTRDVGLAFTWVVPPSALIPKTICPPGRASPSPLSFGGGMASSPNHGLRTSRKNLRG